MGRGNPLFMGKDVSPPHTPPFPRKAEYFLLPTCPAIASGDSGWSQKAYQIISPQWEYSVSKKSEVWLLLACPAIAVGDDGLPQWSLSQSWLAVFPSLTACSQWEQGLKHLFPIKISRFIHRSSGQVNGHQCSIFISCPNGNLI